MIYGQEYDSLLNLSTGIESSHYMVYLISEILLYLLAALLIGFIMGWVLRGLKLDRYTRSLQIELDKKNTGD